MSLFPAYSGKSKADADAIPTSDWLTNSSFHPQKNDVEILSVASSSSDSGKSGSDIEILENEGRSSSKVKTKKKKKVKSRRKSPKIIIKKELVVEKPRISKPVVDKWDFENPQDLMTKSANIVPDRFYDVQNLQFGGFYKNHIAKYRYISKLKLGALGGNSRIDRILRANLHGNSVVKCDHTKDRYFSRKVKKLLNSGVVEHIRAGTCGNEMPDVIEIVEPEIEEIDEDGVQQKFIYDSKLRMYKKIDAETAKLTSTCESEQKSIELNKLVNSDPNNICAWLELVNIQDQLFKIRNQTDLTKESKKTGPHSDLNLLERKISILDKAISKNASNVKLQLERLNCARDIWEKDKLREEWKRIEFQFVNSLEMWRGLFTFVETGFAGFTVSRLIQVYDRCLTKIQQVILGKILTHQPQPGTKEFLLEVIARKCNILASAGHSEKAIATLQALIEFNIFAPPQTKGLDVEHKRRLFEPFWDSQNARIGQIGAKGWTTAFRNKYSLDVNNKTEVSPCNEDHLLSENMYNLAEGRLWVLLEGQRSQNQCLPNIIDPDPEDVETIVLFDDIQQSLLHFSSQELLFELCCYFLEFMGAKLIPRSNKSLIDRDLLPDFPLLPSIEKDPVKNLFRNVDLAFELLIPEFTGDYKIYFYCSKLCDFAQRLRFNTDINLKMKIKSLKKFAKDIFENEENKICHVIYFVYANLLKHIDEKSSDSQNIAKMILGQLGNGSTHLEYLLAVRLLILICENHSDPDETLLCVTKFFLRDESFQSPLPPVKIIKLRKLLEEKVASCGIEKCESPLKFIFVRESILLVCILAEVLFASTKFAEVKSALEVLHKLLENENLDDLERSVICRSMVSIVDRYKNCTRLCPGDLVTKTLETTVLFCPTDSYFMRRYIDFQSQSELILMLRRKLDAFLDTGDTNLVWTAILYCEFGRYIKLMNYSIDGEGQMPEHHKIINVLEKAVNSQAHNSTIWLLYMKFEQLRHNFGGVKTLFYRAVRACPHAKQLYIQVVQCSPANLQIITDLMIEKEVRLRLPLEELQLLMKHANQIKQAENDDSEMKDAIVSEDNKDINDVMERND